MAASALGDVPFTAEFHHRDVQRFVETGANRSTSFTPLSSCTTYLTTRGALPVHIAGTHPSGTVHFSGLTSSVNPANPGGLPGAVRQPDSQRLGHHRRGCPRSRRHAHHRIRLPADRSAIVDVAADSGWHMEWVWQGSHRRGRSVAHPDSAAFRQLQHECSPAQHFPRCRCSIDRPVPYSQRFTTANARSRHPHEPRPSHCKRHLRGFTDLHWSRRHAPGGRGPHPVHPLGRPASLLEPQHYYHALALAVRDRMQQIGWRPPRPTSI